MTTQKKCIDIKNKVLSLLQRKGHTYARAVEIYVEIRALSPNKDNIERALQEYKLPLRVIHEHELPVSLVDDMVIAGEHALHNYVNRSTWAAALVLMNTNEYVYHEAIECAENEQIEQLECLLCRETRYETMDNVERESIDWDEVIGALILTHILM